MNQHLSLRSGNPTLNAKTFSGFDMTASQSMTISGTVQKTGFSLLLLMAAALFTWNLSAGDPRAGGLMMVGMIGGFVLALITIFKQHLAKYTVPAYSIFQGLALGGISKFFETMYPGIVTQAVMLTFGTLGALLLAYISGLIKPTENFKLGIVAATGGIAFVYLISWILSWFSISVPLIHSNSNMGILFSIGVVVIAALNLVLDFDFIEEGAEKGAPKYMEWYAAFGLMITLIWLYIEILNLLMKLRSRR